MIMEHQPLQSEGQKERKSYEKSAETIKKFGSQVHIKTITMAAAFLEPEKIINF